MKKFFFVFILLFFCSLSNLYAKPPYWGTIFDFPDVINSSDPTTFQELIYVGRDNRDMFDRRKGGRWINKKVFLFNAIYEGRTIEIQVNPEFKNPNNAFQEASFYSETIGRLPNFLLTNVKTVWIHKGNNDWGGGNENLLIHTGSTKEFISEGIFEDCLLYTSPSPRDGLLSRMPSSA